MHGVNRPARKPSGSHAAGNGARATESTRAKGNVAGVLAAYIPSFRQRRSVVCADVDNRTLADRLRERDLPQRSSSARFESLAAVAWLRRGFHIPGHEPHHLRILSARSLQSG